MFQSIFLPSAATKCAYTLLSTVEITILGCCFAVPAELRCIVFTKQSEPCNKIKTVMEDIVKHRRGQRHLGTCSFCNISQCRRIQALPSKFLSDVKLYVTFKLYRLLWRQRSSFRSQQRLANPLQTVSVSLSR